MALPQVAAWGRAFWTRRVPFSIAFHWRTFLLPVPPIGTDRRREDIAAGTTTTSAAVAAAAAAAAGCSTGDSLSEETGDSGVKGLASGRVRWDGSEPLTAAWAATLVAITLPLLVGQL